MVVLFDRDNKYKTILVILLILFAIAVAIGIAVSNIDVKEKPDGPVATVVNDGDLIINYTDGELINFSDNEEHTYKVSITNNSTKKLYYSLYIENPNIDILDIVVKDNKDNVVRKTENVKEKIINLSSINGSETVRYTLVLKNTKSIRFYGMLKVVNESLSTEMFSDLLLLNNSVSVAKTRIGNEVATDREGLIETYDNDGKSYYFRGYIDNNYFKINNLMFRIVRINGDNSVRVVLDGVLPNKYAYNTNSVTEGADTNSLSLLNNASLNTVLNDWYNTNLKGYTSYLTKGSYCTDTTFNLVNNNVAYSVSYERTFNDYAPDLFCSGNVYKSNIGLLSVDEIVLAGAASNKPNTSYYLYNKGIEGNYLTTSTHSINIEKKIVMMNVMSNGALGDGIIITEPANIRPVINISPSAKIKGEGTINNPYIIVS